MAHKVKTAGLEALKDDPFVDLTVQSNGKSWRVHRTYFAGESPALIATLNNRMKEGTESIVTFNEYYSPSIECLLYDEINVVKAHFAGVPAEDKPEDEPAVTIDYPHSQWKLTSSNNDTIYSNQFVGNSLSKRELTGLLHVNIQLYTLGDMYFLPDLQKLALEKVLGAEQFFIKSEFDLVLNFIWDNTAEDDVPLRLAVYRRCVINHEIIEMFPKVEDKLKEKAGFVAWETAKQLMAEADDKKERARSAGYTQADARARSLTTQNLALKQNLAGLNKAHKARKAELSKMKVLLRADLVDSTYAWYQLRNDYCPVCNGRLDGVQPTGQRDNAGLLLFRCVCGGEFSLNQG